MFSAPLNRSSIAIVFNAAMCRHLGPWTLAPLLLVTLAGPALAQERRFRSVDAVAGQQVRLARVGTVSQECQTGPAPEVNVITPPKSGQLAIRDGRARAGSLARCPEAEFPTRVVLYKARDGYRGTDEVVYEVRRPDGRVRVYTIRISIVERSNSERVRPEAGASGHDGADE